MKHLGQLVKDVIPVIIGILIALLINNWNEERKEKKYLNQIFTSINKELELTVADIKESIPKEQVLIDTISKYLNDETVTIFDLISRGGGIHGANIKNSSWKAIASSKIELIEFQKLSELSEIDESKINLEMKREKLLDFTIANLKNTDQEQKEVFMLLSAEIISTEKYLQSEIEEFLNPLPIKAELF